VLVVLIPRLSLPSHLRLQLLVDSLLAVDIFNKVGLLDDWRWLRGLLSEDVPLEEIRKPHGQLIVEETLRWDREDLCEKRTSAEKTTCAERGFTYGRSLPG